MNRQEQFEKLIVERPSPDWFLLKLPNRKYAAFWYQGFPGTHMDLVLDGDPEIACAFIGTKKQTLKFIADDVNNIDEF